VGFIKKLLQSFKSRNKVEYEILEYNRDFIKNLVNDHQRFFELYHAIKDQFVTNSDYDQMKKHIQNFKVAIELHLMMEDTKLYGYLRKIHQDNELLYELVEETQQETDEIADEVLEFIEKYSHEENYKSNINNFMNELEDMYRLLSKRIELEENKLFPLYRE